MSDEVTESHAEHLSLEEISSLMKVESLPSSCENGENISKNVLLFLSQQLDRKGFIDGFVYIWGQWTNRPFVTPCYSFGCLFKLLLWGLRYKLQLSLFVN